jgi:hypothetical protein
VVPADVLTRRSKVEDKVVTKTVVVDEMYTLALSADDICSILTQRFQNLGDNIIISISCSQDMLDSVTLTVENKSISRDEIKLSELPK